MGNIILKICLNYQEKVIYILLITRFNLQINVVTAEAIDNENVYIRDITEFKLYKDG